MNAPSFADALRVFARIGLMSFGGPAAQIAVMHRELVDRGWLTERQFLNALSFCMLLPGPEAMQLATFAGWRLHGLRGGLAAGLLFVLPGAALMLGLAWGYAVWGAAPLVAALFMGVKAAVVVIVVEALLKVAKRALKRADHWALAGLAFVAIFFAQVPFPLIVLAAALYGFARGGATEVEAAAPVSRSLAGTARTALVWLAVWAAPVGLVRLLSGPEILYDVAGFFSTLAVVTFGGAYAVLAYMAQDVVSGFGWLTTGQMMDGLGLAETTMGPLILVTEFVGFLAGHGEGGWPLGLAAAALTLWVTFAPCFLWIFVGAPYIDWLGAQPRLAGALSAITAAVVGVILNLSLWFALHVFFGEVTPEPAGPLTLWTPTLSSIDPASVALAALAAALLLWRKWGVARVLGVAAGLGLVLGFAA